LINAGEIINIRKMDWMNDAGSNTNIGERQKTQSKKQRPSLATCTNSFYNQKAAKKSQLTDSARNHKRRRLSSKLWEGNQSHEHRGSNWNPETSRSIPIGILKCLDSLNFSESPRLSEGGISPC
jgi:hypothetical protein